MKKLDGEWVKLIQMAKELGLTIEEVRGYIEQTSNKVLVKTEDKLS